MNFMQSKIYLISFKYIYVGLVESIIRYGIIVQEEMYDRHLHNLQITQNRILHLFIKKD